MNIFKRMFIRIKRALKAAKEFVVRTAKRFIGWCDENPELVLLAAPIVIKSVKEMWSKFAKSASQRWAERERHRIDHTYYDRRTDIHWTLKRKMTNAEAMIFEMRKDAGESTYRILYDLGLI